MPKKKRETKYDIKALKAAINERKKDAKAVRTMATGGKLTMKDSSRLARVTANKGKKRDWSKLVKVK